MSDSQSQQHDKLLETATELFRLKGFGSTSVRDLTAAMGIGRARFYALFGNKRGLLEKVLEAEWERSAGRLEVLRDSAEPLQSVRLFLLELGRYATWERQVRAALPDAAQAAPQRPTAEELRTLDALLGRAARETRGEAGSAGRPDPVALGELLASTTRHLLCLCRSGASPSQLEEAVSAALAPITGTAQLSDTSA